jgi:hypothetical protein
MMLNRLADILYPNRCEVIKIKETYIYPIYKNGRSSINSYTIMNNCKILINEQIKKCDKIDIVLRDPMDRFVSGVNTFVWNLKRDNPTLDINTILYFVENYLFLNRHYAPQISWIINLSRYINADTKLVIHSMEYISELTNTNVKPLGEEILLTDKDKIRLKNNVHNALYLKIDSLLLELLDQELTYSDILDHIKNKDIQAFKTISCIALD